MSEKLVRCIYCAHLGWWRKSHHCRRRVGWKIVELFRKPLKGTTEEISVLTPHPCPAFEKREGLSLTWVKRSHGDIEYFLLTPTQYLSCYEKVMY
jgi:hypothetical protein